MGKTMNIKEPKAPVTLSLSEMESIIRLSGQKMSQKNIAKTMTTRRAEEGITKKMSTNTVSRILTRTNQKPAPGVPAKGKYYQKQIKDEDEKYRDRKRQKEQWEKTIGKIKDKKKQDDFSKAYKKIIEGSRGRQHELEAVYDEETDEYYFETA